MAISITLPDNYVEFESTAWDEYKFLLQLKPAGIYVFYDVNGVVLYVGKTKNFTTRLLRHLRAAEFRRDIYMIRVYFVPNQLERELYETFAINELKPSANVSKVYHEDSAVIIEDEIAEIDVSLRDYAEERAELVEELNEQDYNTADLSDVAAIYVRLQEIDEQVEQLKHERFTFSKRLSL